MHLRFWRTAPEKKTLLSRKTFIDEHIDLTGYDVEWCDFNGCVVEMWRGKKTSVEQCAFTDCRIQGDGWPAHVIDGLLRHNYGRLSFRN